MHKITIKDLKEKLNNVSDDITIDLMTDDLFNLIHPNSTVNKFKFVYGDWSSDGHGQSREFTYISEEPLINIQNAFKDACKDYGIVFDEDQLDYVETKYRPIFSDYEDCSISIDLLKHLEDIGINISNIFNYSESDYYQYKKTNKFITKEKYITEDEFAYLLDVDESLTDLIIALIKLKLPNLKIDIDPMQSNNVPTFNGYWGKNDMNIQIGYGLYGE